MQSNKLNLKCTECGTEFERAPSLATAEQPFCSRACYLKKMVPDPEFRKKFILEGVRSRRSYASMGRELGITGERVRVIAESIA